MNLTNVFVNILDSASDNVLKDGHGTEEGGRILVTGTVVGAGPQQGSQYFVGSSEKNFGTTECTSRLGDRYVFTHST